jgi:nucleoside-diphosphate-sugar epimerase
MILLVGSRGNLSLAAKNFFNDEEIQVVGSDVAKSWCHEAADQNVSEYFYSLQKLPKVIINTAGVVNPSADLSRLIAVNYHLPRNLNTFSRDNDIKLVTFGTIMENSMSLSDSNPYLKSKRMYFDFLQDRKIGGVGLHLQIHTWYGGYRFHDHMFLSQVFNAISTKSRFQMSNGMQFREYHHIDDDLTALKFLLDQNYAGVIQLNHGEATTLKELAHSIFKDFGLLELLEIDKLKTPENEILRKEFIRNEIFQSILFRETRKGIHDYFKKLLNGAR